MAVRPAEEARFAFSVPLVVIGAGACGLTTALAAAERGVGMLVLERDRQPTGSTSLSAGLIPAAGTRFQREAGIDDSAALFAADLIAKADGENDPAIVRAVAESSGPTIEWLVDAQGLELELVEGFTYPGHSRLRMHGPRSRAGADLQAMLLGAAARAGIDILTSASAEDLYVDEAGRVVAVGARRPDGAMEVIGCDAVMLASCGFGGNREMVRRAIPAMADAAFAGHASNTGDAMAWGEALGARLADLGGYQGHGSMAHPHGLQLTWAVITQGGFQVNAEGRRFANEMRGYSEHAEDVIRQPGGTAWVIYDERCETAARAFHDYAQLLAMGAVKRAGSLPELAAMARLPEDAFARTHADIADFAAGRRADPLGRDFMATPPLTPPFRAVKVTGALLHTQGGPAIDVDARVLRREGGPFPNLFAGGGAARGLSGASAKGYLSGNGLLSAVVIGRIAGASIAARLASA